MDPLQLHPADPDLVLRTVKGMMAAAARARAEAPIRRVWRADGLPRTRDLSWCSVEKYRPTPGTVLAGQEKRNTRT